MTPGSGFPGEWWTPPADAAMRDRTPREALAGRVVVARLFRDAVGRSQAVALWRRRQSSREDETSSEDGVDGGRRETAWARVKIRGRGGSGEA